MNLNSGFCIQSFKCQIQHFQSDISGVGFPRKHTCPIQNKSSHAEPFMEFYFSPIFVFQNISLANSNACKCNDWSPAASLLLAFSFLSMRSEGVKSKSYGQARAEPGNKGIIFISLPPIKVSHKRKKAPRSNRREIQDFDESTPALPPSPTMT